MATVHWAATTPGGVRATAFFASGSTSPGFIFPHQPSSIVVINTSSVSITMWVDHYSSTTVYAGNVTHFALAPGSQQTVSWNPTDVNWVGMGINGDTLHAGSYTLDVLIPDLSYCAAGTQPIPGSPASTLITGAVIATILGPFDALWMTPIFAPLLNQLLDVNALCTGLPAPLPPLDASLFTASPSELMGILRTLAWYAYCQCTPATPTPTPPPAPRPTEPPGFPTQPPFPCDPTTVCTALTGIWQQLNAISATLGLEYQLTTTMQRYGLPFAYVRGARQRSLTGSGTIDVSAAHIVGVLVEVTSDYSSNREFLGAPPYVSDLGWISVLDGDGMIDEIRLTRQAQTWTSKLAPTATLVGYALRDGVVADITPLLAEP